MNVCRTGSFLLASSAHLKKFTSLLSLDLTLFMYFCIGQLWNKIFVHYFMCSHLCGDGGFQGTAEGGSPVSGHLGGAESRWSLFRIREVGRTGRGTALPRS